MKPELTCIICNRELDSVSSLPEDGAIPYNGTIFTSYGHYGSTIFDSFDGTFLQLTICDLCIVKRKDNIIKGRTTKTSKTTYESFEVSENEKEWVEKASEL